MFRIISAWLERHIVGDALGELIAELNAAHSPVESRSQTVADVLGHELVAVLERGLSVLGEPKLRSLIRWPWVLRELQQSVLLEGGDFWRRLPQTSLEAERERIWKCLGVESVEHAVRVHSLTKESHASRVRHTTVVLVAAAILMAIGLWQFWPRTESWGWNRPGAFASDVRADQYLRRLADLANEYFAQPRDTPQQLERTLTDFRRSCDVLLAAKHEPLSETDRAWLRERCQVWSKKFDDQLAELHRTGDTVTIRAAADETVTKLLTALRARASTNFTTSTKKPLGRFSIQIRYAFQYFAEYG